MTATKPAPKRPNAADSHWLGAYPNHTRELTKMRDYLEAGRTIWWRRKTYWKEAFRDVEPKWHVFASRVHRENAKYRGDVRWSALCGYGRNADENLATLFDHKVSVPKKADRCLKCEKALRAIAEADEAAAA